MGTLADSQAYCHQVARQAKSSFPAAFRLLPAPKRRAMTALYAFLRITDDLADEPGELVAKRQALADWRQSLAAALDSAHYEHPVHAALVSAVTTHAIEPKHLHDVLDGVEMDLEPLVFRTFGDLYPYCYRVASAVGLACIPIWGLKPGKSLEQALPSAEAAGVAFQLTNILRDLAEDQARGRVYLPSEDLAAFGIAPDTWQTPGCRDGFHAMMRFQATRARGYYETARHLDPLLTREGRAIYGAMTQVYQGLLDKIENQNFDVFRGRIRLSPVTKAWVVARAFPVRWGIL